jgi:hypothetical protein
LDVGMSSSDPFGPDPDPDVNPDLDLDPAIAEAVDGVTNRFGAEGLEQMIAYAEQSLAEARAALDELARPGD